MRLEDLSRRGGARRLRAAGMDSLPGGGAEMLADRVRSKIAKAKCTSAEWLEVMRVAHRIGMRTTATMMFGTADTLEDRVLHMLKVRDLQDETGGFTAFICWDYQHEQGTRAVAGETGTRAATCARRRSARLVLDNVAEHPDFVGHAGARRRPGRPALRRQRHGQHDVRGERGVVCGHDVRDGRAPDRAPRARERLQGRRAATCATSG